MQNTVAVFANQAIHHSPFPRRHGRFVNKAPVPLVEVERFLSSDRIMGVTVPCDQPELGKVPNDEGVGCGVHKPIMHDEQRIFKRTQLVALRPEYSAVLA